MIRAALAFAAKCVLVALLYLVAAIGASLVELVLLASR